MRTDKQVYSIFSANPQWLFELTGLQWPGPCMWKSVSFKALEQTSDGVLYPDDITQPLTVTEIQAQSDPYIYARVVIEMALLQQHSTNRHVQGVILFFSESLDPQVKPWPLVVQSFYLDQLLERLATQLPDHPLVAVFRPVMVGNRVALEKEAGHYNNQIKASELPAHTLQVLLDVFVNWLEQRFSDYGKKEIEKMLIGTLPDLRETQSGKDLILIGREEGKIEGKIESLLLTLETKFGALEKELRERISNLTSAEEIDRLFLQALTSNTLDGMKLGD